MFQLLKFCRLKDTRNVIIRESELLEFYELGRNTKDEIVGALVGLNTNENYLILNIFKYKGSSTHTSVRYKQIENSMLPAGLEILGTIHTHPGFGAFLSETDLRNLKEKKLNKIAIILDPENFDLKAFGKDGRQMTIDVAEDYDTQIKFCTFYKYGIPFRVYMPNKLNEMNKIVIKNHIDRRYSESQMSGIYDLIEEDSIIYYRKPKVISLKYKNKVPLYFFIKNQMSYVEWFENVVLSGVLDFQFTNCIVIRNGKRIAFEDISNEVVRDGITEFFLF